jgi:hypothetical protein
VVSFIPPRKEALAPIEKDAGWILVKENTSNPMAGIEPQSYSL